jgi:hypothetical protein
MLVISDLFRARQAPQSVSMACRVPLIASHQRSDLSRSTSCTDYCPDVLWSSSFARCGRPSARRAVAHAVPLVVEAVVLVADVVSLVLGSRLA